MLTLTDLMRGRGWRRGLMAPEGAAAAALAPGGDAAGDGAGGGGAADPAAGAAPPAGDGGAGAGGAGGAGAGGAGAGDGGAPAGRWWESLSEAQKTYVTATGRTRDDPLEVLPAIIDDYLNAQKRLGAAPDALIEKPKGDQKLPEWLRANAETFGLPADAEGYAVERPDDLPKEIPWNADLEAQARAVALENGVPREAHEAYVRLFADHAKGLYEQSAEQIAQANAQMMEALSGEWGAQTEARITRAAQAASVVAEKAGLDQDALANVAAVLSKKTGDAATIRIFDAMAEALGDDSAVGLGKGNAGFAMTPAEARAELARLRAPEGDYNVAVKSGDSQRVQELTRRIEHLSKLAAG